MTLPPAARDIGQRAGSARRSSLFIWLLCRNGKLEIGPGAGARPQPPFAGDGGVSGASRPHTDRPRACRPNAPRRKPHPSRRTAGWT